MSWQEFCQKNKMGSRFHDATFKNSVLDKEILSIAEKWILKPASLIIHGKSGRGKTYFSICLMKHIFDCYGWSSLRWFKSKQFDDLLISYIKSSGNAKDAIESFSDVPFFFLDDFGTESVGDHIQRDYFELIDYRWADEKVTVITTNLDEEEIKKAYGQRIYSRFRDYQWIEFNGEDLRGNKSWGG